MGGGLGVKRRWDRRQIVEAGHLLLPTGGRLGAERRWYQRQIAERQLLLPTGGGLGEEVGSAADRIETIAAPHGWGTRRKRWDQR